MKPIPVTDGTYVGLGCPFFLSSEADSWIVVRIPRECGIRPLRFWNVSTETYF